MYIRKAKAKDTQQILHLLSQVLELHAAIRPDIFVPGTTKYTPQELQAIFRDPARRTFVAVDERENVLGYAFCEIHTYNRLGFMVPRTELYIDDLCVERSARGQKIGSRLFRHVQQAAEEMGCHAVTLNVWTGNDSAEAFYEKMGMTPRSTKMERIINEGE